MKAMQLWWHGWRERVAARELVGLTAAAETIVIAERTYKNSYYMDRLIDCLSRKMQCASVAAYHHDKVVALKEGR